MRLLTRKQTSESVFWKMLFPTETETAGGTWVGSVDEKTGLYHGQGKMAYPDGCTRRGLVPSQSGKFPRVPMGSLFQWVPTPWVLSLDNQLVQVQIA